jgi:transposase
VRNRVQKLLEGVNLKLASVISDIAGVSGRAILTALAGGEADPKRWQTRPTAACKPNARS